MDEAIYKGFAQFSDSRVSTALDLLLRSRGPYRLIISDRQVSSSPGGGGSVLFCRRGRATRRT